MKFLNLWNIMLFEVYYAGLHLLYIFYISIHSYNEACIMILNHIDLYDIIFIRLFMLSPTRSIEYIIWTGSYRIDHRES